MNMVPNFRAVDLIGGRSRAFRAVRLSDVQCPFCAGTECYAETRPYVPGFAGVVAKVDAPLGGDAGCDGGTDAEPTVIDTVGISETLCTWCGSRWVSAEQDEANIVLLRAVFMYARQRRRQRAQLREAAERQVGRLVASLPKRAR